ncbi:MAG: hypothetical protein MHM6MM_002631 [Cercozoa sp. M6MM]
MATQSAPEPRYVGSLLEGGALGGALRVIDSTEKLAELSSAFDAQKTLRRLCYVLPSGDVVVVVPNEGKVQVLLASADDLLRKLEESAQGEEDEDEDNELGDEADTNELKAAEDEKFSQFISTGGLFRVVATVEGTSIADCALSPAAALVCVCSDQCVSFVDLVKGTTRSLTSAACVGARACCFLDKNRVLLVTAEGDLAQVDPVSERVDADAKYFSVDSEAPLKKRYKAVAVASDGGSSRFLYSQSDGCIYLRDGDVQVTKLSLGDAVCTSLCFVGTLKQAKVFVAGLRTREAADGDGVAVLVLQGDVLKMASRVERQLMPLDAAVSHKPRVLCLPVPTQSQDTLCTLVTSTTSSDTFLLSVAVENEQIDTRVLELCGDEGVQMPCSADWDSRGCLGGGFLHTEDGPMAVLMSSFGVVSLVQFYSYDDFEDDAVALDETDEKHVRHVVALFREGMPRIANKPVMLPQLTAKAPTPKAAAPKQEKSAFSFSFGGPPKEASSSTPSSASSSFGSFASSNAFAAKPKETKQTDEAKTFSFGGSFGESTKQKAVPSFSFGAEAFEMAPKSAKPAKQAVETEKSSSAATSEEASLSAVERSEIDSALQELLDSAEDFEEQLEESDALGVHEYDYDEKDADFDGFLTQLSASLEKRVKKTSAIVDTEAKSEMEALFCDALKELQGEVPRSLLFRNYAFRLRLADAQARRSLRRRILAAGGHVLDGSTNEQVHFVVRETLSQHSAVNNLVHNNSVSGHTRSSFMQTTPPKEHPLQQEIRERRDAFRHAGVSLNATEVSAEQRVEIEHFLRRASLGRTRSVTPAWVDACLADNLVYAITESPLFVPLPHAAEAKRPQEGLLMTYSELAQSERRRVTKLAELLALPHESCFRSRSTSHVLAQQGTSKKVQSARKYSVPVVTWSWLYDSVLTQKVLPVLHYTLDLSTRAVRHTLPLLALASDVRDHRNRLSLARGQQQSDQPSDQYDQPSDQYDQDQIGLGGNDDDDLEKQPQPQQQDQQEHTLPLTVVEPPENSVVHVRDIIRHHAGTDTQASVTVDENSGTVNNARVKAPLNDSSVGFKRPRKRDDWPSQWSRTRVHVAGNKSQVEQMLRQLGARVLKHPTAKTIQFVVCDASLSLPKSLQLRVSTGEVRRRSVDWVRRACLAKGIVPPDSQDEAKQEAKHEAKQEAKQEAKHEAKCEATQEQPLQREISCTFSRDEGPPPSKKRRVLQHSNSTQESKRTKQLRVLLSGFESTSGVRAQLRELPLHVVREAFLNDVSTCEQAKTFDMLVLARPLITAKLLLAIATRATIVSASWCTSALTTPKLPEAKDHLWQEDEKITRAIAARARKEALPLRGKRVACYALQNRREQLFRHLVAALGATVVTRDDLRRGDVLLFELSALSSESKRSNVRTAVLQQAHALGARLVDSECVQRWLMSPTASAGMPLRGLSVDDAARQMVPHT